MKVTREKTEDHQAFLTVELSPEEIEEASKATYLRLVQRVNVPGFRKGKAPRQFLVRHVGSDAFLTEIIEDAVPEACDKAIMEQEIDLIARPQIELVEREPVTFKAIVPLKPVIELGDYKKARLKPEKIDVNDERIDAVVDELRHQWGTWEVVERAVAFSDIAVMDVESTIDGEPFINQQGARYQVIGGSPSPAPGFAEEIVGMKAGEEKDITLKFPEDDERKDVAGKEVIFKVKVTTVQEEKLPEINDELAIKVDAEIKTVKELRSRIESDLTKRAEERSKGDFEDKIIDAAVEVSEIKYPPVLIEVECRRMMDDQTERLRMQGITMEQFLGTMGKSEEEFHDELHPLAEKRLERGLVLGKLAEVEEIRITPEDIDAEIENMVKDHADELKDRYREAFNGDEARESIGRQLLSDRTIGRLSDFAQAKSGTSATKTVEPKTGKPAAAMSKKAKPKADKPKDDNPEQEEQI